MRSARSGILSLLLAGIGMGSVVGQRPTRYSAEVGGLTASDQTPFWLRANQYGTVPLRAPVLRVNAGLHVGYRPADSAGHRPKADWGAGVEIVTNVGTATQVLLPEAYVKGRFGAFELYGGRRREFIGLVDTLLTTGSYAWSGNALPIPEIQLALPTFTSIPFTKGVISVMGAYAHGWFNRSDRLVKGSYLHHKYVYGRLGKPTWPFRLYGGFNHQVIWAGFYADLPNNIAMNGQLPSSLRNYPAVVFGTQGDPNDKTITSFEWNRIGNHLGSIDVAADVNIGHWNLFVYRQFMFDDGSLYSLINVTDGLNGLRFKNRNQPGETGFFLRQVTVEYLFTGNQGGDVFVIDDALRRGRDDYFNHSQFVDGWVYYGRTIGTPFLMPASEVRPTLPYRTGIANNRVSVVHFGLSSVLFGKVDVTTRLSFSQNAGTYNAPYPGIPKQFSGLLTASVPVNVLGGIQLNGSVAIDSGELLPNSVGGYVSLRKTGLLSGRPANGAAPSPR